jgi:hypothetical protein
MSPIFGMPNISVPMVVVLFAAVVLIIHGARAVADPVSHRGGGLGLFSSQNNHTC